MTLSRSMTAIVTMLCVGAGVANAADGITVRALSSACSKSVDPSTMVALVHFESGGNPYAINVNGGYSLSRQPQNKTEAIQAAKWLETNGYNFDSGMAQINSDNLRKFNVSSAEIFDPCVNLRVGSSILLSCYMAQIATYGEGQDALRHALSCYNTGNSVRGIANGYVRKVIRLAQQTGRRELMVPALQTDTTDSSEAPTPSPKADRLIGGYLSKKARVRAEGDAVDAFGETGGGVPDAFGAASAVEKPDNVAEGSRQGAVTQGKPNGREGLSSSSISVDEDSEGRDNPESHSL